MLISIFYSSSSACQRELFPGLQQMFHALLMHRFDDDDRLFSALWLIRSNRFLLLEGASGHGRGVRQRDPANLSVGVRLLCNAVDRVASCISCAIAFRDIVSRREITCSTWKEAKRSDRYILKPVVGGIAGNSLFLFLSFSPLFSPSNFTDSCVRVECVTSARSDEEVTQATR